MSKDAWIGAPSCRSVRPCALTPSGVFALLCRITAADNLAEVDCWVDDADDSQKNGLAIDPTKAEDPLYLHPPHRARAPMNPADLDEMKRKYPTGSGMLNSDHFVPAWCLTQLYKNASASDLQEGMDKLAQVCARQGDAKQVLLNKHAGTFIDCFEAISVIDAQINHRRETRGLTKDLLEAVQLPNASATKIFEPMLSRRRACEKDRIALNVLRENAFLFSLPKVLKLNVEEEAWATVIQNYHRAKSLFAKTTIRVFEQILAVVENIIEDVRQRLFAKLENQPLPYEELNKIIGFLSELGAAPDPSGFCLEKQRDYVLAELQRYEERLDVKEDPEGQSNRWDNLRNRFRGGLGLSAPGRIGGSATSYDRLSRKSKLSLRISGSSRRSASGNKQRLSRNSSQSSLPVVSGAARDNVPQHVPQLVFIEEMSQNLNMHLPSMWKLGHSKLQRSRDVLQKRHSVDEIASRQVSSTEQGEQDESDDGDVSQREKETMELEAMVMQIIDSYADKVRQRLIIAETLPDQASLTAPQRRIRTQKRSWLPKCETQIRKCLRFLTAIGLSESSLSGMVELLQDFQRFAVNSVFFEVTNEIRGFVDKEDWRPADNGLHTSLPELFEEIMMSAMSSVSELCHNPASDQIFETEQEAEELVCVAQEALTTCFTRLAFENASIVDSAGKGLGSVEPDKRLMLIMSNCLYTRKQVARTLAQKFETLRLGSLDNGFDDCLAQLEDLDFQCFDSLLTRRSNELSELAIKCVEMPARPPRYNKLVVRTYMKEILLNLVRVHANVNEYSRPFVFRVISQLAVRVAQKIFNVLIAHKTLGKDALSISQLQLEIAAIRKVLAVYDSGTLWDPISAILEAAAPTEAPPKPVREKKQRKKSPAPAPASSKALPTPGGRKALPSPGGKALPTPGGRKALPSPGGKALPNPGGRKALPSPGGRKALPSPGGKALPNPGGRKALPNPGGRKALPSPGGKALPPPGGRKALPSPGGKALPTPGGRKSLPSPGGNRAMPTPGGRKVPSRASSAAPPLADVITDASEELPPPPESDEEEEVEDEPWDPATWIAEGLERFLSTSTFQYACFKVAPVQDGMLDDDYVREFDTAVVIDTPGEDFDDDDEMV